jgi:hypothetical protein
MKERNYIACFSLGNREIKRGWGRGERDRCLLCVEEESDSHLLLLRPETLRWKEWLIKSKWSHTDEGIEIGMITTVKNSTKQRNLDSLAHNIKCK